MNAYEVKAGTGVTANVKLCDQCLSAVSEVALYKFTYLLLTF